MPDAGETSVPKPGHRFVGVAAVTCLALGFVAVGPFLLDYYTVNILVRACLYAVAALTVDVLWGYAGILTFAQGAFFGIGAYAAALVFTNYGLTDLNAVLALAAGMIAAALVAGIVGWFAFWHGAQPLYAGVVTLVLPVIIVQLLYSGGTLTGSSSGLVGFDTFDLSIEQWFWIAGSMAVLATAVTWLFVKSDAGRLLVAIRENENRCSYLGIDTARIKTLLLMAMAALAAAAGYAYACFSVVVAPEMASLVFGTELVIYTALGGRGTLIGPVLGTIVVDTVSSYLSGELPYVWRLIIGTIFIFVIVVLPQGLMPPLWRLVLRLFRRWAPAPKAARLLPAAAVTSDDSGEAALVVDKLERAYGSLKVLQGVDLSVRGSELLSVVGPNGAGKTTLMRCVSDGYERTAGTVTVNGNAIGKLAPHAIVGFGLGRSFQTTSLFETLTVSECLRLARTRLQRSGLWTNAQDLPLPAATLHVVQATGLLGALDTEARNLSHGMKRALELAMVLALEPSVLLLDEPTAGLTKPERTLIGSILVELCRDRGMAIVIIEHDLEFVREISSRVVVLHQGAVLLDGTVEEVVNSELVRSVYAGKSIGEGAAA